jgi:hypothetical protein
MFKTEICYPSVRLRYLDQVVAACTQPLHLPDYSGVTALPFNKPVLKLDTRLLESAPGRALPGLSASVFGQAFQQLFSIDASFFLSPKLVGLPHTAFT